MTMQKVKTMLADLHRRACLRRMDVVPDDDDPEYEERLIRHHRADAAASTYYFCLMQIEMVEKGEAFDVERWHRELQHAKKERIC